MCPSIILRRNPWLCRSYLRVQLRAMGGACCERSELKSEVGRENLGSLSFETRVVWGRDCLFVSMRPHMFPTR